MILNLLGEIFRNSLKSQINMLKEILLTFRNLKTIIFHLSLLLENINFIFE